MKSLTAKRFYFSVQSQCLISQIDEEGNMVKCSLIQVAISEHFCVRGDMHFIKFVESCNNQQIEI